MAKFDITPLDIPDVILLTPEKFTDSRGFFMETFRADILRSAGIVGDFVQDNHSLSVAPGTIRGLHFQRSPNAQAKLVRALTGSIFDVAVDLRPESATFGRWCSATLTPDKGEQLFIPAGFAHGFCTLEANTQVHYKVNAYYSKDSERGIIWHDA